VHLLGTKAEASHLVQDLVGRQRPLRSALGTAVARHLAALGDRADRRHVHRQAAGRRAGRLRGVRQRRALGSHEGRPACRARPRPLGVPRADRLLERSASDGEELDGGSRPRAARPASVRGVRDRQVHEAATARAGHELGTDEQARQAAHLAGDRHAPAQPALRRDDRRAGVPRAREPGRLRSAGQRRAVLSGSGRALGSSDRSSVAVARAPGLPVARLRTLRIMRARAHRQLVEGPARVLRLLPLPSWLPRRERDKGQARGPVHRGARGPAAHAGLHAATEGVGAAHLEDSAGDGARVNRGDRAHSESK
jgi:hypothetical protein